VKSEKINDIGYYEQTGKELLCYLTKARNKLK
jgi:hypothetical protein